MYCFDIESLKGVYYLCTPNRYYLLWNNIMFWLTMMKHDEEYCKPLVNAALSEYAAAYPLC